MRFPRFALAVAALCLPLAAAKPPADPVEALARLAGQGDAAALSSLQTQATQGNPEAQDRLGNLYDEGTGVKQDGKEAARLYGLAAAQGYADAEYDLGLLYFMGESLPHNYPEAYFWFSVATAAGNQPASAHIEELERRLTPSQIAAVKKRIAAWAVPPAPAPSAPRPK